MIVKLPTSDMKVNWQHHCDIGKTLCFLNDILKGVATCSMDDHYCKETGRKVSMRRAIQDLPRQTRKLIWETYLNRKNG